MFYEIIDEIIDIEGGYVDSADDPGGETKYGISKRAYPDLDISCLTKYDAIHIYERDYLNKPKIGDLPYKAIGPVLDAAINMGPRAAIRLLQAVVGTNPDGIIGPKTIKATDLYNGDFLTDYMTERVRLYMKIPTWNVFGLGWMRRVIRITAACQKIMCHN